MKQLGLAFTQYNQDFDEASPNGVDAYCRGSGWAGMVYPYVKSTGVFQCPDDTAAPGSVTPVSYIYNSNNVIQHSSDPKSCSWALQGLFYRSVHLARQNCFALRRNGDC